MIRAIAESKSKTFIITLLAFGLGVLVYSFVFVDRGWWPAIIFVTAPLVVILLIAAWLVRKQSTRRLAALGGLFFVLAILRFAISEAQIFDPATIAGYVGETVTVRGAVVALPEVRGDRANYLVATEDRFENLAWQSTRGRVMLRTQRYPEFAYGDRLLFSCEFENPPNERGWLAVRRAAVVCFAREGVERVAVDAADPLLGTLITIRSRALRTIEHLLPEPYAGLLAGLLVGERAGFTDDLTGALRATGTMHMVAISGFNVAVITIWLFAMLRFGLGRKRAFWATLALVGAFVFIVGGSASVFRAAIMGSIVLVGKYLGRDRSAARLLVVAVTLMLAINPWLLRYDLGFLLSVAATAGLLAFGPFFERHFQFLPKDFKLRETLSATLAATLATLPITVFAFGQLSLIAPAANLVVLLLVAPAMLVGFLTVLVAAIPILGAAIAFLAWGLLAAILGFVEWFAKIPHAAIAIGEIGVGTALFFALGLACLAVLVFDHLPEKEHQRPLPFWELFIRRAEYLVFVMALATIGFTLHLSAHPGVAPWGKRSEFALHVFDVGQGDAILVESGDAQMLVDGGPDDTVLAKLGTTLPFGDRDLDLVVLTHPHADHVAGLVSVLERYRVGRVLVTGVRYNTPPNLAFEDEIIRHNITREIVSGPTDLMLGSHKLEVLYPLTPLSGGWTDNPNDASIVLRGEADDLTFLLAGDIEEAGERAALESGLDLQADILKVAHHGSRSSSTEAFIKAARSRYAFISAGEGNSYGHPHFEVIRRLEDNGARVLRTDRDGDLTVRVNEEALCILAGSRIIECESSN